jgi:hypothetical protein
MEDKFLGKQFGDYELTELIAVAPLSGSWRFTSANPAPEDGDVICCTNRSGTAVALSCNGSQYAQYNYTPVGDFFFRIDNNPDGFQIGGLDAEEVGTNTWQLTRTGQSFSNRLIVEFTSPTTAILSDQYGTDVCEFTTVATYELGFDSPIEDN